MKLYLTKHIKSKYSLLLALFIFIINIIIFFLNNIPLNFINVFSLIMTVLIFLSIHTSNYSLFGFYSLFVLTSLLFLEGRIVATLIDSTFDPFIPLSLEKNYINNEDDNKKLLLFVNIGFSSINLGFHISNIFVDEKREFINRKINKNIYVVVIIVALLYLGYTLIELKKALIDGYLALFAYQEKDYSLSGQAVVLVTLNFLWALVCIDGNKKAIKVGFIYWIIIGLIYIFIGARAKLLSTILFLIWYQNAYIKKINFLWILSCIIGAIYIGQVFVYFGIRGRDYLDIIDLDFSTVFTFFLYGQGMSLMVFDLSFKISDWPNIAYFQSIIPLSSFFGKLFGYSFTSYDTSFGNFASYTVSPEAFMNGNALGWTLLGDFVIFADGNIIFYIIIALCFGILLGIVQRKSFYDPFWKGLLISNFGNFVMCPRGGVGAIVPYIFYYCIFYFFIKYILDVQKSR